MMEEIQTNTFDFNEAVQQLLAGDNNFIIIISF